jgi:hypothetical protein
MRGGVMEAQRAHAPKVWVQVLPSLILKYNIAYVKLKKKTIFVF